MTCLLVALTLLAAPPRDIRDVEPDLVVPEVTAGEAAAGRRVKQTLAEYKDTQVYHILYLPTDWTPDAKKRWPVIVEYAGNGPYHDKLGDVSTGEVEGNKLGYGISAGKGFIWLCLPYVNRKQGINQRQWWGDVEATVDYCKQAVRQTCDQYGGDPQAVILAGFSRGAIACGYIGLHDDEIAKLWRAFIPYSHYDGVRRWGYADDDRDAALVRLKRLGNRPSFVCHENSVDETRRYIESTGVKAPFTFRSLGFRNHNNAWVLRPSDDRATLRAWVSEVLRDDSTRRKASGDAVNGNGEVFVIHSTFVIMPGVGS